MLDGIKSEIQNFDLQIILKYLWDGITFETFLKFLVIYFIIVWVAILVWVIKDITNRTSSILLQIFSILLILFFTPFWVFIYLLIRPGKTIFEKYYSEIEDNLEVFSSMVEDKVINDKERIHCYKCKTPLSTGFKFCPSCKIKLKWDCEWCWKLLYKWWKICPYCWNHQNKEDKKKSD